MDVSSSNNNHTEIELWRLYVKHNDLVAREALIKYHMPLAKKITAGLYAKRIDDGVEFFDYLQFAHIGLIEAIDKFDPDRNVLFGTYASYRISGSILDGVCKLTEKREQMALHYRLNSERIKSMALSDDSDPDDLFGQLATTTIGLAIIYMLEDTQLVQSNNEKTQPTPYAVHAISELKAQILYAVDSLSGKQKVIIQSHYFEHKNFNEIADVLGVTKGRVSQIHKHAVMKLKCLLENNSSLDIDL